MVFRGFRLGWTLLLVATLVEIGCDPNQQASLPSGAERPSFSIPLDSTGASSENAPTVQDVSPGAEAVATTLGAYLDGLAAFADIDAAVADPDQLARTKQLIKSIRKQFQDQPSVEDAVAAVNAGLAAPFAAQDDAAAQRWADTQTYFAKLQDSDAGQAMWWELEQETLLAIQERTKSPDATGKKIAGVGKLPYPRPGTINPVLASYDTVVIYINGINTNRLEAERDLAVLTRQLMLDRETMVPGVWVKLFWNHSATPPWLCPSEPCADFGGAWRRVSGSPGASSTAKSLWGWVCSAVSVPFFLVDIEEAVNQDFAIWKEMYNQVPDLVEMVKGSVLGGWLGGCKNVILIPHSQGNYFVQRAMLSLGEAELQAELESAHACTPTCPRIGLISTGSPLDLSSSGASMYELVQVRGDIILWLNDLRAVRSPAQQLQGVPTNHSPEPNVDPVDESMTARERHNWECSYMRGTAFAKIRAAVANMREQLPHPCDEQPRVELISGNLQALTGTAWSRPPADYDCDNYATNEVLPGAQWPPASIAFTCNKECLSAVAEVTGSQSASAARVVYVVNGHVSAASTKSDDRCHCFAQVNFGIHFRVYAARVSVTLKSSDPDVSFDENRHFYSSMSSSSGSGYTLDAVNGQDFEVTGTLDAFAQYREWFGAVDHQTAFEIIIDFLPPE